MLDRIAGHPLDRRPEPAPGLENTQVVAYPPTFGDPARLVVGDAADEVGVLVEFTTRPRAAANGVWSVLSSWP